MHGAHQAKGARLPTQLTNSPVPNSIHNNLQHPKDPWCQTQQQTSRGPTESTGTRGSQNTLVAKVMFLTLWLICVNFSIPQCYETHSYLNIFTYSAGSCIIQISWNSFEKLNADSRVFYLFISMFLADVHYSSYEASYPPVACSIQEGFNPCNSHNPFMSFLILCKNHKTTAQLLLTHLYVQENSSSTLIMESSKNNSSLTLSGSSLMSPCLC